MKNRALTFVGAVVLLALVLASPDARALLYVNEKGEEWPMQFEETGWHGPFTGDLYVVGDLAAGEDPDLVTASCNRPWLVMGVGDPTWEGTEWTVELALMVYHDGTSRSGSCHIEYDHVQQGIVFLPITE